MDELARAQWRKSTRSGGHNDCVEMTRVPRIVAVRDSKDPGGDVVALHPETWAKVSAAIKAGEHDL
jgi:hypothetical protein